MKKLSDDLWGYTDNMHERALALESRIEELEERDRQNIAAWKADNERHELRIRRMKPFLRHKGGCDSLIENSCGDPWGACDCGLAKALNQ